MPSSTAMTITAMRRCRQKPTNWSIIEQDSAARHHLLARLHSRADHNLAALLEERLDGAPFERPGRGGHEHAGTVVVHEQRRARQYDARDGGAVQRHRRKHVRLERVVWIAEGDAGLVAPRVRLDHI